MKLFCSILLIFMVKIVSSQENDIPVLEREITISAENQPLEKILNSISSQAGFVFSYNPEVIVHIKPMSIRAGNKSVRYVLNQLFNDKNVDYKVKGKYVILKRKGDKSNTKDESRIFEGYVYDYQSGDKLTQATVYEKNLMASAITDKYGYFSMELPANTPISSLQISKLGYADTLLISPDSAIRFRNLEISLKQNDSLIRKQPLIDFQKFKPGWLVPEKLKINAQNISEPVFRSAQFSLFPYLSTNRLLGGVAINDFSLNLTVGYVQGIRYFEAGGVLNYVRNNVSFFQAAGVGNIVGGNVTGFQAAGIFNAATNVTGFQAAGVFNQVNTVHGTQAAGVYNWVKNTANVQLAGVFNMATKNEVQIAGVFNKSTTSNLQIAGVLNSTQKTGFQISGLINHADTLHGGQITGLLNLSRQSSSLQISGGMNITKEDAALQISGIFNRAKHSSGLQLSFLNFADTSSGISIGLFSFIKKGYHKIEISADETFPVNLAFRTGTHGFHTFLIAGGQPTNTNDLLWNFGYGLGTSMGNRDKWLFDIDFSSQEIIYRNNFNATNHWYKLYIGLDRKVSKKMSIAAGISYNALLSDSFEPDYQEISSRLPLYSLSNTNYANGHNLKTWIGGKIALRLF